MRRRPTRSTRQYTLVPYTPLFRSVRRAAIVRRGRIVEIDRIFARPIGAAVDIGRASRDHDAQAARGDVAGSDRNAFADEQAAALDHRADRRLCGAVAIGRRIVDRDAVAIGDVPRVEPALEAALLARRQLAVRGGDIELVDGVDRKRTT